MGAIVTERSQPDCDPKCPPLELPVPSFVDWDHENIFEVAKSKLKNGLKVRVVGDVLRVTKENLKSLIRDVDEPITNIAELYLDARDVLITESLSFKSVRLFVFADTVTISDQGILYWTGQPPEEGDGLEFYVQSLRFKNAVPRPFFITAGGDPRRVFVVQAERIIEDGRVMRGGEASVHLWRRTTMYETVELKDAAAGWDVKVSPEGFENALAKQREGAFWPQSFARKLQRHYARDPFGADNRKTLRVVIDTYGPLVVKIGDAVALSAIDTTASLMSADVDYLGHGRGFVSRQDLDSALSAFRSAIHDTFKRLLPDLRELILAAFEGKEIDQGRLKTIRTELQTTQDEAAATKESLSECFTSLVENEEDINALGVLLDQRESDLRSTLERLKRKNRELANIKAATTLVSIGASLVPTVGPFIAAAVAATGDAIYLHNAGDASGIETVVSMVNKGVKFYAAARKAQAAWEEQRKDLDIARHVRAGHPPKPKKGQKPLDKVGAAKQVAKSANQFAQAVKGMQSLLEFPSAPTTVTLKQLEAEDGEFKSLLWRIGVGRSKQRELVDQIEILRKRLATTLARFAQAGAALSTILTADPRNDADVLRWKNDAVSLWRSAIENLYRGAILLRKSVYFETGSSLELPPDLYQFPEETLIDLAAEGHGIGPEFPDALDATKRFLKSETEKHKATVNAIASASQVAINNAEAERTGVVPYRQIFRCNATVDSPVNKAFLDEVNAQIRAQLGTRTQYKGVIFPLQIPIVLASPPVENQPERLVKLAVSKIEFVDRDAMLGKVLDFDVSFELAGHLHRGGECRFVDMRDLSGVAENARVVRFSADEEKIVGGEDEVGDLSGTYREFKKYQTLPLARTPYYVCVKVEAERKNPNWQNVPQIEMLEVELWIVQ